MGWYGDRKGATMELKHNNNLIIPRAALITAMHNLKPCRVVAILKALCRSSIIDYFSAVDGDFTFSRGDGIFRPQNAPEGRFWDELRAMQKDRYKAQRKYTRQKQEYGIDVGRAKKAGIPLRKRGWPKGKPRK